ncbi:MAG: hypothetical protein SGCHY_001736 [Lobulomycetales sp.]
MMFWFFLLALLEGLAFAHVNTPPIRHYDFVGSHSLSHMLPTGPDSSDSIITLAIPTSNNSYTLKLKKNKLLLLGKSTVHLHDPVSGSTQKRSITAHPYAGSVVDEEGKELGWARIMFHYDPFVGSNIKTMMFEGAFSQFGEIYHISTVRNYARSRRPGQDLPIVSPYARDIQHRNSRMLIFKDVHGGHLQQHMEHLPPKELPNHYGCGFHPSMSRHSSTKKRFIDSSGHHLQKRQSTASTCFNPVAQVLQMRYGGPGETLSRIISNFNVASRVYEDAFNIKLAIVEVKIMQSCGNVNDEVLNWNVGCAADFSINERLTEFSRWRGTQQDTIGLWHLMSLCSTGPTVGIAWLQELCSNNAVEQTRRGKTQAVSASKERRFSTIGSGIQARLRRFSEGIRRGTRKATAPDSLKSDEGEDDSLVEEPSTRATAITGIIDNPKIPESDQSNGRKVSFAPFPLSGAKKQKKSPMESEDYERVALMDPISLPEVSVETSLLPEDTEGGYYDRMTLSFSAEDPSLAALVASSSETEPKGEIEAFGHVRKQSSTPSMKINTFGSKGKNRRTSSLILASNETSVYDIIDLGQPDRKLSTAAKGAIAVLKQEDAAARKNRAKPGLIDTSNASSDSASIAPSPIVSSVPASRSSSSAKKSPGTPNGLPPVEMHVAPSRGQYSTLPEEEVSVYDRIDIGESDPVPPARSILPVFKNYKMAESQPVPPTRNKKHMRRKLSEFVAAHVPGSRSRKDSPPEEPSVYDTINLDSLLVSAESPLTPLTIDTDSSRRPTIDVDLSQSQNIDLGESVLAAMLQTKEDPEEPSVPLATQVSKLTYDGSFETEDGHYHVNTVQNYGNSQRVGQDISIVSPLSRTEKDRYARMIVFKDGTIESQDHAMHLAPTEMKGNYGCGVTPTMRRRADVKADDLERYVELKKRQSSSSGECRLKDPLVLTMGVAADCTYTENFGGPAAALQRIISNWNQVSRIYENTFNIELAIVEVKIMQGCGNYQGEELPWNQPCSDSMSINERLSAFSQWRGTNGGQDTGLWHLMTKCNTGPSVGVAWLNELCTTTASAQTRSGATQFISGAAVSSIVPTEYKVVAHEIAHNFGAIHDCTSSDCPAQCNLNNPNSCGCCPCGSGSSCDCKGTFIMHPTDNSKRDLFSSCSRTLMCQSIQASRCLRPRGSVDVVRAGVCGNGVKEPGEDCDCGSTCESNSCCNSNCRFINDAKCDDRIDECCESCQVMRAGTTCRTSDDFCTISSVCTGKSGVCPKPKTQPDGAGCILTKTKVSGTACASGTCTSRQMQCRSLIQSGSFRTVDDCKESGDSCSLRCSTPSGTCVSLSGDFIDGTPCVGGVCRDGSCQVSDPAALLGFYFTERPQIAWPVTITFVIVIAALIYGCTRFKPFSKLRNRRNLPPSFAGGVAGAKNEASENKSPVSPNKGPAVPPKPTEKVRSVPKPLDSAPPVSTQKQQPQRTPQHVDATKQPNMQAVFSKDPMVQAQFEYFFAEQQRQHPNADPRVQAEYARQRYEAHMQYAAQQQQSGAQQMHPQQQLHPQQMLAQQMQSQEMQAQQKKQQKDKRKQQQRDAARQQQMHEKSLPPVKDMAATKQGSEKSNAAGKSTAQLQREAKQAKSPRQPEDPGKKPMQSNGQNGPRKQRSEGNLRQKAESGKARQVKKQKSDGQLLPAAASSSRSSGERPDAPPGGTPPPQYLKFDPVEEESFGEWLVPTEYW